MFKDKYGCSGPVPVVVAVFACFVFFIITIIPIAKNCKESLLREAEQKGIVAAKTGVPAEANPYVGKNSDSASAWLDGWIMQHQEE